MVFSPLLAPVLRVRRRLAAWIAPTGHWAYLPPLPAAPRIGSGAGGEPPVPERGAALLLRVLVQPGVPVPAAAQFLWRWLDGNPLAAAEAYLPRRGLIVELGCGEGLFTRLLMARGPERRIAAVEADPARLAAAVQGTPPGRVVFEAADPFAWPVPPCDGIALVHRLGASPSERQVEVVRRCAAALRPGGRLVVVEHATRPLAGRPLRLAVDAAVRALRLTREPRGQAQPAAAWVGLLASAGLRTQIAPPGRRGWTPRCLVVGFKA